MALTLKDVRNARYTGTKPKQRVVLWCDNPRGFGLRVFPPVGDKPPRKTFVLFYRTAGGTQRLHTIGDFGTWTLDTARAEAKRLLVEVERDHADPVADKGKARLAAKTGSVKAMFEAYVEARRTDPVKPMKRADDLLELAELHIYPRFGARQWQEVRRSEVREWFVTFKDHPSQGNNAIRALRASYNWRMKQEDESPSKRSAAGNPAAGVALYPTRPRQVRLEPEQLPALEAAIDAETDNPYLRAYFRFLLATGSRRTEALELKWEHVDLERRTVTFPDTKNTDDRIVPLAADTAAMLKALPRVEGNPHVFVGKVDGAHLVGVDKPWERIRTKAGVAKLTKHDVRRTFGSWLGDAGFTSKQIGEVLGHRTDITSRVYMALGDKAKRQAVTAHAKLRQAAMKPKRKRKAKSADVIPFPRARAAR